MPEVQFQPGSKTLLVSLLDSIKDFLPTNAANLIFTPRGLALRFASGRNTDSRVVVACHLDAEANHRPFTFARSNSVAGPPGSASSGSPSSAGPGGPPPPPGAGKRRSSVGQIQLPLGRVPEFDDGKSDAGESAMSAPEGKMERERAAAVRQAGEHQPGMYGIIGKYVCQRDAVLIGFSPQLMMEQLKLVDEEDTVTVRAEEAEDGSVQIYEMYIESRDLTRKCLFEVDAIPLIDRFVPLPDIQYNVVCQIETKEFNRIVEALHGTSDKIAIMANKNSITFCATGSDGTLQVGLVQKPGAIEKHPIRFKVLSYNSAVKHVVDSRLLKGFTKASPLSPYVLLFLPATPSPSRPAAPIRVTYEITVFEFSNGSVVLSSEFNPKKHLPPPPSASSSASPASFKPPGLHPQNAAGVPNLTGWRNSVSEGVQTGWNKDGKRGSVASASMISNNAAEKRGSIAPTDSSAGAQVTPSSATPGTPDAKTFASVVSKDKENGANAGGSTTTPTAATPTSNPGFLGISAPRSSTPVGVHASGAGMGVSVTDEYGIADEPAVQVRVVGQLHYLLAPELGAI